MKTSRMIFQIQSASVAVHSLTFKALFPLFVVVMPQEPRSSEKT